MLTEWWSFVTFDLISEMRRSSASGREIAGAATVVVGLGLGVAAFAGMAGMGMVGAAVGTGIVSSVSSAMGSRRSTRKPLVAQDITRNQDGTIENWKEILKIIRQEVRQQLRAL